MDVVANYQAIELGDYLAIIKRRKWALIFPFLIILAISVAVAMLLPPTFRSESRILVERQEIPQEFIASTVTGYVTERVRALSERVLTRENLWRIANEYDLYAGQREVLGKAEIVKMMRKATSILTVDVEAAEVRGNVAVTVAFMVGFEADSPITAQQTAAELTRLVLEENRRGRSETAAEVAQFLNTEAARMEVQISELEAELAAFKQKNRTVLPELASVNMRLLEQAGANLERTEEKIRTLELQHNALMGQLAVTNPYLAPDTADVERLNPTQRLGAYQSDYLRLSSVYAYDHPDLVRLRRQIAALEGQAGASANSGETFQQLDALRARLSDARTRYSEDHPDVKSLKASISAMEQQLHRNTGARSLSASRAARASNNPQYVGLQNQINAVATNLGAERSRRDELIAKGQEYEARLLDTPMVERDQTSLTRDYTTAVNKYREIKEKQLKAQLAEQLERENKAERFVLLDPASFPTLPESPNRPGIVLLGVLVAFTGGMGMASILEFVDQSVRGMRGVARVLRAPPLAAIPYIDNPQDIAERSRRRRRQVLSILIVLAVTLLGWHVLVMPLDEQWVLIREWADGTAGTSTPN